MCGLVGIISLNTPHSEMMKGLSFLLYIDSVRGFDATGIALISKEKQEPFIYKKAMSAYDFVETPQFNRLKEQTRGHTNTLVAAGHNRWATRGDKKDSDAHPFSSGRVTLFHNGTINNAYSLGQHPSSYVDSAKVTSALSEIYDKNQSVEKFLGQLEGGYAFVWYDEHEHVLEIARNDDKPLYFMTDSVKQSLIWASEKWMLDAVYHRFSGSFFKGSKEVNCYYFQSYKKYSFNLKEIQEQNNIFYSVIKYKQARKNLPVPVERNVTKGNFTKASGLEKYPKGKEVEFTLDEVAESGTCSEKAIGYGKVYGDILTKVVAPDIKMEMATDPAILSFKGTISGTIKVKATKNNQAETYLIIENTKKCLIKYWKNATESVRRLGDSKKYRGPDGNLINKTQFENLTEKGCYKCSKTIQLYDHDKISWASYMKLPLCTECSSI